MKQIDWISDMSTDGRPFAGSWQQRHLAALHSPKGAETPIVNLLRGWLDYADRHSVRYGAPIGEDGVLGPEWTAIGAALRGLLIGELGRLDAGTLDSIIVDNLRGQRFDPDAL